MTRVEVLRRYSNRPDLVKIMYGVLEKIKDNDQTNVPGVAANGREAGPWRVLDRLSDAELQELIAARQAGTTLRALAVGYGISVSSVKRVLKGVNIKLVRVSQRPAAGSLRAGTDRSGPETMEPYPASS